MKIDTQIPASGQLIIPLLQTLADLGGGAEPKKVYPLLAERLEVPADAQQVEADTPAGSARIWDRSVRWARQLAVLRGHIDSTQRNWWELTAKAGDFLANIRPGVVVTIFETQNGVALWAESQAGVAQIESGLANLWMTSPPYPLLKKKDYQSQFDAREHIDFLVDRAREWKRCVSDDGSIVVNLGDVWTPGQPEMSLYQERLLIRLADDVGLHLAEKLYWHNPSKMPSPAEWVTVKRIRVTPAVENLWWLCKDPRKAKANNRNVLREYSDSMRRLIDRGGEKGAARPSGYDLKSGAFGQNAGGSIPHNLLSFANTSSNDGYQRYCREHDLPAHPARFPAGLVEWLVRFLSDEGDICVDDFGGSLQFGAVCEKLNRRWISMDSSLTYLRGAFGRFAATEKLKTHWPARVGEPATENQASLLSIT